MGNGRTLKNRTSVAVFAIRNRNTAWLFVWASPVTVQICFVGWLLGCARERMGGCRMIERLHKANIDGSFKLRNVELLGRPSAQDQCKLIISSPWDHSTVSAGESNNRRYYRAALAVLFSYLRCINAKFDNAISNTLLYFSVLLAIHSSTTSDWSPGLPLSFSFSRVTLPPTTQSRSRQSPTSLPSRIPGARQLNFCTCLTPTPAPHSFLESHTLFNPQEFFLSRFTHSSFPKIIPIHPPFQRGQISHSVNILTKWLAENHGFGGFHVPLAADTFSTQRTENA